MKWFLFLIPLLFYSVFSDAAVSRSGSSPSAAECAARPVLYGVGMHNYWNDSDNRTHAYYDGCEYIQKGLALENPSIGYSGDWYPTGAVMPEPGQGSGSHPGNDAGSVDLLSMGSPVMDFANLKEYKKKGNTSAGQSHFLYNGALYSVSYDAAKDVTTYTPVSYDPSQKQSYSNLFYNSINSQTSVYISFLNNDIKELQKTKSIIDSYINSRHDDKVKYFNDYQSLINLSRVYSQLISAAQTDISKVNSLGINPSPVYLGSSDSQSYAIYTESNSGLCGLNYNYCDVVGVPLRIVYHNKDVLDALKKKYDSLPSSSFVYSKSETYVPYKPVFNVNSYSYFTGMDFFSNSANSYLNSARFGHSPPRPLPFMDFSQSVDDSDSGNPDTGDSGSGDTSVTPPGGGGTVTPPVTGGGGGGGSGGTDTPDTGSQCVPGSPGWPDCDDQSGQSGGGDSSGDSGSGGDKPGTGDSGGGGGGSGGGHGSGGDGHGGGDTDGDGDALLQEVKRFHADVNAALKPDSSAMPQFSDKDADFSDVQKDLDKQEKEQGEAWASGADKLKSTLGGISGSLPSTELDMSKAVPVGITGVCRPWEFDIVIGITDGKQFKQHVVMTQFCTWYDTYIRPFVTWAFNFLTAVAVFNILYKGLRTID